MTWERTLYWAVPAIVAIAAVHFLGPVLTPFAMAAGLAYLGDPLVDRLESLRLSRTAAVTVVFATLTLSTGLAALLLFPLLEQQLTTLIRNLPRYGAWLQSQLAPLLDPILPADAQFDAESMQRFVTEHWGKASNIATALFKQAFTSGTALIALALHLLFVPVITFYLLRDWDKVIARIHELLPRRIEGTVTELARETDEVLGAFIRGQLLVMVVLALVYMIGLWLVGLDLAALIGLVSGLIAFVPYLGLIVGLLSAGIAILVQTQELLSLVWIALVFGVGQILEEAVLRPYLIGDRIGLHPVTVIFAVLAGGHLFGFVGVLLALPVAAVLAVVARHLGAQWRNSEQYLRQQ